MADDASKKPKSTTKSKAADKKGNAKRPAASKAKASEPKRAGGKGPKAPPKPRYKGRLVLLIDESTLDAAQADALNVLLKRNPKDPNFDFPQREVIGAITDFLKFIKTASGPIFIGKAPFINN